ncbi:MAG: DMT family transporter [Promethearchaeota archaeon]
MEGSKPLHFILLLLMVFIWSASFLVVDQTVGDVTPLTLAAFRLVVASISFLVVGLLLRRVGKISPPQIGPANSGLPTRKEWVLFLLAGTLGVGLFFPVQYVSISFVGPSIPALMVCLFSPIVLTLLATVFFKEKVSALRIAGIIVGAAGAGLILTGGEIPSFSWTDEKAVGNLMAFLTPFMWAGYSLATRELAEKRRNFQVTAYSNYVGCLVVLAVVLATGDWRSWSCSMFTPAFVLAVLYLALGCSLVGYFIWLVGLKALGASRTSVFLYLEPFITVLLAFAIFHYAVSPWALAGGLVVLAGVVLVTLGRGGKQ